MASVCIHRGANRGLCGSGIHGPCSVRVVGRRSSLSGDLASPAAQLPRSLRSNNLHDDPPRDRLITQPFDFSRYVHLTWFVPGTQEYIFNRAVTHPFSTFIPNHESLIHSLYLYIMTYLRTIELYWGLGQSPYIITCVLVVLRP